MTYSNDPQPNPYAHIPSPLPNIDFPAPYWINKLKDLIIVGCLDPDLAFGALLIPAAAKMAWTLATPGTKQIVEMATGASWLCGTKQIMSGVQQGEEIASSDTGRFIYGLGKGLDIQAYYAFMLSTGAEGVIDFASFAAKFLRVCNGDNSKWRGYTPTGGWPSDTHDWLIGPAFTQPGGGLIGYALTIPKGQIGAMIAWCSFSNLFGSGGVVTELGIQDFDTGEFYDVDIVDNRFNTTSFAVVRFFTTEGRADRDLKIQLMVKFDQSVEARSVPVNGGCYIRAWDPNAGDAPPYWNMKTMLKSSHDK